MSKQTNSEHKLDLNKTLEHLFKLLNDSPYLKFIENSCQQMSPVCTTLLNQDDLKEDDSKTTSTHNLRNMRNENNDQKMS